MYTARTLSNSSELELISHNFAVFVPGELISSISSISIIVQSVPSFSTLLHERSDLRDER